MPESPEIVCICGSMRFAEEMRAVSRSLTLAGVIVLMPGEIDIPITDEQKAALGELHLRKIDVANRVVVVNRASTSASPRRGRSTMRAQPASP